MYCYVISRKVHIANRDKAGIPTGRQATWLELVTMRNTYLVTYDISNDLRLRRVHKTMLGYGDHLQY